MSRWHTLLRCWHVRRRVGELMATWIFILMAWKTGVTAIPMTEAQCKAAMIAVQSNGAARAYVYCIAPDGTTVGAEYVVPNVGK